FQELHECCLSILLLLTTYYYYLLRCTTYYLLPCFNVVAVFFSCFSARKCELCDRREINSFLFLNTFPFILQMFHHRTHRSSSEWLPKFCLVSRTYNWKKAEKAAEH